MRESNDIGEHFAFYFWWANGKGIIKGQDSIKVNDKIELKELILK
jgi:hypothetical protein